MAGENQDTRYKWLKERVIGTISVKDEVWMAVLNGELKSCVISFLEDEEYQLLLVYTEGKELKLANKAPPKFKKGAKAMYFVKSKKEKLTNDSIQELVNYGDFGEFPLEHLSAIAQDVFLPLLTNPANQQGWPEVVSKEVTENLHRFIANVCVTIGQTKGQTLLPLPPQDGAPETMLADKDKIHILEYAVVTWTKQIKTVIKADPDAPLKAAPDSHGEYPGPLVELDFWTERAANLNSIHTQLTGEKITKVVDVLQAANSTYHPAFERLMSEVVAARTEANDNVKMLKPLRKLLEKLNLMDEFGELVNLFKPIMHTIMLIWKHSAYYCNAARIVTLMREIANDLIMQARKFLPGDELKQMDAQEAVDKLKLMLKVLGTFKLYYFDYKTKSVNETPDEKQPWKFQNSALFGRLDTFMERANDLLDIQGTALQFSKLERVEIGGTKGKILTADIKAIHADFIVVFERFQAVEYDVCDVDVADFEADFARFRAVIQELECRLGSIIIAAFDDCTTVGATFKLLDAFEGLLERDVIASGLAKKNADLISAYGDDLREVADLFAARRDAPIVAKNSAPHSGSVAWVRGLSARVDEPMAKIRGMAKSVLEGETAKEVMKLHATQRALMEEYERGMVEEWCGRVASISDANLSKNLLRHDEKAPPNLPLLRVNFDPELVKLLRETKYFLLLKAEVPETALAIFERADAFRTQIGNLELIVGTYNKILKTILPVERPLISAAMDEVAAKLDEALRELNWNSPGINEYIREVLDKCNHVDFVLTTIKENVASTRKILARWSQNLMWERKEATTYKYDTLLEGHRAMIDERHRAMSDDGKEISKLLSNSNRTLKISKAVQAWKDYVEYVSEIVVAGFSEGIIASIRHVYEQVEPQSMAAKDLPPLLEVNLQLDTALSPPDIVWSPDLGDTTSGDRIGVRAMFNRWLKSFMQVGTLMKRLDIGEGHYLSELQDDYEILDSMTELQNQLMGNEVACLAFRDKYQSYEHLYRDDLKATLDNWLQENAIKHEDGTVDDPPLSMFEAEVAKYKKMCAEVEGLPATQVVGWVKIDALPLRKELTKWSHKWVKLFTTYLTDKVVSSMNDLYAFVEQSTAILDTKVGKESSAEDAEAEPEDPLAEPEVPKDEDGNELTPEQVKAREEEEQRQALYKVMSCMRDIRKRAEKTEKSFEPLRDTVTVLQTYGIGMDDKVLKQLDEAPLAWKSLNKKNLQRREHLAPLQQAEAIEVRRRSDAFGAKVDEFRKYFQKTAPFSVEGGKLHLDFVEPSYVLLNDFHHGSVGGHDSTLAIIAESEQLKEYQDLFELYVSDYIMLTRCKEELGYLKSVWDVIGTVMFTFRDWNTTPWDKIDVEFLMEETKKLAKDVKQLNKAVRNYDVYRLLEESIKAMQTSLPLVQELHHPAMRERHWKQLMKATGVNFVMDDKFSLGDLLQLGLHQYVDACSEIVDRAQKELKIEKDLEKIENTWTDLHIEFSQYQDTDVQQIGIDDSVQEALENDTVQLQGIASGKYVQGNPKFLEMVGSWQTKLGNVESVLGTWQDVQKKWQALESIFVGSADIRVQLPEDSKRFDGINANFLELMSSAPDITNVVEACNLDGRGERLDEMLAQLELCEKALQDYLETKRIAFPRFYFVAAADLLDILSKGSNPQLILRHLSKNFDNIHNLEFTKNEFDEPTKSAIVMVSGEGERVEFREECVCDGPVETWLNSVVDAMRTAVAHEFGLAVGTYDEKPRPSWIFLYSAQNTITVTRTFYTAEVNEAFDELEEGNEDALKGEFDKQVAQLADLIDLINTDLKKLDRKKLITLCTIDVHARDVIQRLIDERVEDGMCFQWQSQLRYYQNEKTKNCQVNICDAEIRYNNEYIGNVGCLCITPLTDRCYITLTQAQRLVLGGAPAGPAGTGKTETTKDLARHLGVQCYVFNCSDQMDYKAMGQIYKGLAQTGAWGCFDEFNRIPVAVLSVCSTQYKTVLDAIRARKPRFVFEDVEIQLLPTVMAFITMNPGYPGRAELPESLKALFRPVSMVLPDLRLICEIMLMAEGFQASKLLSRKFVILYTLCEALLSKSAHYDWKLRAIKTTLYVAGSMKRDAPELSEDKVLLRALRDFNLGKLTADDTSIFMGLLNDLFPKTLELVPRAVDHEFEKVVRESAVELGLQPDETFCLKISQLREIFVVRWSVFLLGAAGCGKSAIWKTLRLTQNKMGEKTVFKPVNPKSVTRNELYGFLHPTTREWKEGLMSVTFRDFSNNKVNQHQWIVLDGDIDAEWIESMNTVMDDNKMLTLASNERIPLTGTMRLLLEINHMVHCSPATVSRGGVIFVNAEDVGWRPVVDSWIEKLEASEFKPLLTTLFTRYVDVSLDHCRRNFKYVVQLPAVSQAMFVCKLMEGMLPQESVRGAPPPDKKLLEYQFVFACVWAFGGCMLVDKVSDYRVQFSKWWQSEWKNVQYPEKGTVFDYWPSDDGEQILMLPWEDRVPSFDFIPDPSSYGSIFVPTVETTRLRYFLDELVAKKHYVMFVGNTGTGKTAIMNNKLRNMDADVWASYAINMNSFSDAPSLQLIMEQPLEKKSGVRYGPPGGKHLVYFVDDMNMPFVDKYDTQSAIELARQLVDYNGWYDKVKILLKEILNCQYCACMNPTAGSFQITPRMQRHFVTFAVQMPSADIVRNIYMQMVEGHLSNGFDPEIQKLGPKIVDATIELHRAVMNNFLPSAVKFHYQFNLRELSNMTLGLMRMDKAFFKSGVSAIRLWIHEAERVFRDRLVNDMDMEKFDEFRLATTKKFFESEGMEEIEARPNLFCSFLNFDADDNPVYTEVPGYEGLKKILDEKLQEHNETNAAMNLVLFQQAMEHICRISRIIDQPAGNAMLVGVGGSGKQSLARLASFICGFEVIQIAVSSTYGIADFKENLLGLYTKSGMKGIPVTFLMTDNQIVNERFLVYINDLLSTGYIADLCTPEDIDNFANSVRNECKSAGIIDTMENLWEFFIQKVRKFLHVVLCFSPVGDKFRIRARQFPALVSATVYNFFHSWPHEALVSVAAFFLKDIEGIDDIREAISLHMAHAHLSVSEASVNYLETVRRYNYTTPKSYLELISLYKSLLKEKRSELCDARERLSSGVEKIAQAAAQVADLQVALKEETIIVEEKKAQTGALIENIGQEKAVVDEAVEGSRADEEACADLAANTEAIQAECERDLEAAEPIIRDAEAALNSLDKNSLGELKSFGSPAAEVVQVVSACMALTAPGGKIPKDVSWNAGKKYMGNVDAFLKMLINFDKDNTPENCVAYVEKEFLSNPNFNPDYIRNKSGAAAGLCAWVVNICKYFRIYQFVAPKRAALAEANKKLDGANKKLTGIRAKVAELQARVALLEENLMKAEEDKMAAIAQAEKTNNKAKLADRLINGLSSENKRWGDTIVEYGVQEGKLPGDVLLAAAFVSYAGPFNMGFRQDLVHVKWIPDLIERQIPMREGAMPLDQLTNDTTKAMWGNEGLPTDPLSIENGAIMSNSSRWTLMIDPQLQGIRWVINKEEKACEAVDDREFLILQTSAHKYVDKVCKAIEAGHTVLLENLPDDIDAVLDPLIGKQTIRRGRNIIMKVGDNEMEYHPDFRLYLQTKLSNPHYKPEIAAQTTLVNFCVTEKGLEDQLLALVVEHERPDLQQQAADLVKQLGEYTIQLNELEDSLLAKLAASQGDILEDIELIENLELTKATAKDIEEKVGLAKTTEINISQAREVYRPVATRGSLVYFLIDNLNALDRVYHYSMANFVYVLRKGMRMTPGVEDESAVPEEKRIGEVVPIEDRIKLLINTTCFVVFSYVSQGLFERHKLIVAAQLCMAILKNRGELPQIKFDFLLRGPKQMGETNPVAEWVSDSVWGSVQALKEIEGYENLPDDLSGSAKRWREWMELERPEVEPLPGDWKRYPEFERLLLFRVLRPDRLTAAMSTFVTNIIGSEYVQSQPFDLERSFADSAPQTPIFVFLSPGVDVAASVEALGSKLGYTSETGKYASVSLGQGQEPIAMERLTHAHKNGGWVLLQNIHLTIDWTSGPLEKKVDKLIEGAHDDFRLFLSAEPPPILERGLPISLLQNSIKLTNEPPEGLQQNLARAYTQFNEDMLEGCAKQAEFRSIVFALCYFHAALLERKKFGVGNLPGATSGIGWNMNYPFNTGDLLCCAQCANNYLENNVKVPWDDLRYIFGEIMYGGHIVEDWDRRLANAYLNKFFVEQLLEGMEMYPGFFTPPNTNNHKQVLEGLSEMPPETPLAFGLHPNAEIGFKLREAESFCGSVLLLQPRDSGGSGGVSVEEKARMVLEELVERLPEAFDMEDIRGRVDEFTPYVMVAIQESERMNKLQTEMKRSLAELDLGLKGDLTMSEPMERLMHSLATDRVSASWSKLAYASLRPLASWLVNVLNRCAQLSEWTADLGVPKVVWLSGLFNPQSFLTAVMQTTARRNDWPLDKTVILTEVTKKQPDQIDAPSREGAFIHGLTLEGARWDEKANCLDDSKPKELFCQMPVILVKAVTVDKAELKDAYECPVYTTEARFREEVFTAQLKSKHSWIKWTLAGVCMFLDVV